MNSKKKLIIVSNEKVSIFRNKFYCDNIDIKSIPEGLKNNFDVFTDRENGLRAALDMTVKNDIVIVLGKGREEYQEIGGKLISYSDINIINEYCHES